jgi:hypothetical protein
MSQLNKKRDGEEVKRMRIREKEKEKEWGEKYTRRRREKVNR